MKFVRVYKLGRLANGNGSDQGGIVHAMPAEKYTMGVKTKAFCGTAPARTSVGWHQTDLEVNCPKCKTYIEKRQKARNVTPVSRLGARFNANPAKVAGLVHGMRTENFMRGCRRQALCGAKPGPRSAGWYSPEGLKVTCPECLKRMKL